MAVLWFAPRRGGARMDGAVPSDTCDVLRGIELVLLVAGVTFLIVFTRRVMWKRAVALGASAAGEDAVAEDYVRSKTMAAVVFGIPACLGLLLMQVEHRGMDLMLLLLPMLLMGLSWPTAAGLKAFAEQIDARRGGRPE